MLLHISEFSGEPPHRQIAEQLLDRILAGDLAQGTALQSPQKFARTQRLSVNTVLRAYDDLARKGLGRASFSKPRVRRSALFHHSAIGFTAYD